MVERRFNRLASVGLMVLAPSPEACGIVEILLLEPGVVILVESRRRGDFGDFGAVKDDVLLWSENPSSSTSLGGGCRDFAFAVLEAAPLSPSCGLGFLEKPGPAEYSFDEDPGSGGVAELTEEIRLGLRLGSCLTGDSAPLPVVLMGTMLLCRRGLCGDALMSA